MKRALFFASILLLPISAFALDAPTGFTAILDTTSGVLSTDWDDVSGATKYSVNILAEYDTDDDGLSDLSVDFDFGTSDRTDGYLISDAFLNIEFEDLLIDADEDGDVDDLMGAMARVKALNPGKGNGRQNNPFYSPFVVFYPVP